MHHQHRGGRNQSGKPAFCVCPSCGKALRHVPGVPCNSRKCPDCGFVTFKSFDDVAPDMILSVPDEEENDFKHKPAQRQTAFPFVKVEKCTACGQCMDICPTDTIYLKNGKAFVDESNCRNCQVCMTTCPENAFELK